MSHPNPPQHPYPEAQPPPPSAQPKRSPAKRILIIIAIVFGGLVFLGSCINLLTGSDGTTTAAPAPTVTVTATATETVTESAKAPAPTKAAPTKAAPKPAPAAATMTEGTFEIGVDAPAGRYKTTAVDSCYWERTKDDSGSFDSILANANVNNGARASVTVKKGEFFTSSGCGTWIKVS